MRKLSVEEKLVRLKLLVRMSQPEDGQILQFFGRLSEEQIAEANQLIEKYEKAIKGRF